jgi:hypothetical protein
MCPPAASRTSREAPSSGSNSRSRRRRVAVPTLEALQRYENAADPHRLSNTFVPSSPRAAAFAAGDTKPRPTENAPTPKMIDELRAAVREEVRESLLSVSPPNGRFSPLRLRSASPEAATAAKHDVAAHLAEVQRRREEIRYEREVLEREVAAWTEVAHTQAAAEAVAQQEAAKRDGLLRQLHIIQHQQEAHDAAVKAAHRDELARIHAASSAQVEAALDAVAARDAALAHRHRELDAELDAMRYRHHGRSAPTNGHHTDSTGNNSSATGSGRAPQRAAQSAAGVSGNGGQRP